MAGFGRLAVVAGVVLWVTNPQARKPNDWFAGTRLPAQEPLPSDAASVKDIGFISIARTAPIRGWDVTGVRGQGIPKRYVGALGHWWEARFGPEFNPLDHLEKVPEILGKYEKKASKRLKKMSIHEYLAGANVAVFLMWNVMDAGFMYRNFALGPSSFKRPWTLVTCGFSHPELLQLAFHTAMMLEFGPLAEERVGLRNYVSLYVSVGAANSVALLAWHWLFRSRGSFSFLGGSATSVGVTAAMVGGRAHGFYIMQFGPMSPEWLCVAMIGLHCGMNGADHLPGLLAAAATGLQLGGHFGSQLWFSFGPLESLFDSLGDAISDFR